MTTLFKMLTGAVLLLCTATVSLAGDIALVIGNLKYERGDDLPKRIELRMDRSETLLRTMGYQVFSGRDLDYAGFIQLLRRFDTALNDADRVIVLYAGRGVSVGDLSWLAPVDVDASTMLNVEFSAPSVRSILGLVSQKNAQSLVMLGVADGGLETGTGVTASIETLTGLDDLTTVIGPPMQVSRITEQMVLAGQLPGDVLARNADLISVVGGGALQTRFGPEGPASSPAAKAVRADLRAWRVAESRATPEAFETYLDSYPEGIFAELALRQLDTPRPRSFDPTPAPTVRPEPTPEPEPVLPRVDPAEQAERDLALNRTARRTIQSDLTALGYNTRGIDGIFGRGTRGAIRSFQDAEGFPVSGFLSRRQVDRLANRAERARIEAARIARQAEQDMWNDVQDRDTRAGYDQYLKKYPKGRFSDRARTRRTAIIRVEDRAYWESTGISGENDDLQRYLKRYPKGIYADRAKERLRGYETERQAALEAAWIRAETQNSARSYRRFLERYPDGRLADEARRRIAALETNTTQDATRAWARAERNNTRDAYLRFLDVYPRGRLADEARRRIAAIERDFGQSREEDWRATERNNTRDGYLRFLELYPNSPFADEARRRISGFEQEGDRRQRRAWRRAEQQNTLAGYEQYLRQFPNGPYASEARNRVAAIRQNAEARYREAWQAAERENSIRSYQRFLQQYPEGRISDAARERIAALQNPGKPTIDEAWYAAEKENTAEAYRRFLKLYSSGRIPDVARQRIAALEQASTNPTPDQAWYAAEKENSVASYRRFLQLFPTGRISDVARQRIAALEGAVVQTGEQEAWITAERENTVQSYNRFISQYPNGELAKIAARRRDSVAD